MNLSTSALFCASLSTLSALPRIQFTPCATSCPCSMGTVPILTGCPSSQPNTCISVWPGTLTRTSAPVECIT